MATPNMKEKPRVATPEYIEKQIIKQTGKTFDKASMKAKIELVTKLTEQIFITRFGELKKNLDDRGFSKFWIEPTKFGKGYRQVFVDLLKAESYKDATIEDWYPYIPKQPEDREVQITNKFQHKIRYDINEPVFWKYFKNPEDLSEYINMQIDSVMKTLTVFHQQLFYNIFATSDTPYWDTLDDDLVTSANAMVKLFRDSFKNKVEVKYKGTSNLDKYTAMVKAIIMDIKLATEKANLTNSAGQVADPIHIKPDLPDLVLFVSQQAMVNIAIDVKAGIYNDKYFDFPNITIIEMSSLADDEYKLVDKTLVQFSINLAENFSWPINPNTLWVVNAYHEWFYFGIVPYAFGKFVKMVSDGGSAPVDDPKPVYLTKQDGTVVSAVGTYSANPTTGEPSLAEVSVSGAVKVDPEQNTVKIDNTADINVKINSGVGTSDATPIINQPKAS